MEGFSHLVAPAPALHPAPSIRQLDSLTFGTQYNGPAPFLRPGSGPASGATTPPASSWSEAGAVATAVATSATASAAVSRPGAPPVHAVPTLSNPPHNGHRFFSACLLSLGLGLNDSAPGALLPYIESAYSVDYATVSLIFVANAIGFLSAAPFAHALQARAGQARTLFLTQLLMLSAYVLLVCRPPFPVVAVAFYLSGVGMAVALALNNVFCSGLANPTTIMGVFHGSYGIGGILGPLIATALVSSGRVWATYYFLPLGLAVLNGVYAYWAAWKVEKETMHLSPPLPLLPRDAPRSTEDRSSLQEQQQQQQQQQRAKSSQIKSLWQTIKERTTLLGALFIFAYQGAEVSISGWVLSFLLTTRTPDPAAAPPSLGYVTSGFWGGITLGRFLLAAPAQRLGEKLAVFGLVAGSVAFQLLVWLVPNIIGEAVAVAIVGVLLGPVYPCAITVFRRLLSASASAPSKSGSGGGGSQLVSALAFVSAMGSSGGAVAPFMTGLVSQHVGTWVLNPIAIALFLGMIGCWAGLGRLSKRSE